MFGRRRGQQPPDQRAANPAADLRARALRLDPAEIGLSRSSCGPVWGVLMDTGFTGGGWFSLMSLADGTTSLYSSGSSVIGAGEHDSVRAAAEAMLATAAAHLDLFGPAQGTELPSPGTTVIRALTFAGPRTVVAPEDELGHGRHPASAVFHAVHEVIGRLREVTPVQGS